MLKLTDDQLQAIRPLGTTLVTDAIDTFEVRLRNEGFISGAAIQCMTPDLGPMIGYAVPARIRSVHPPMRGATYAENYEWWNYVRTLPKPRIVVLEDFDHTCGLGAFMGEMHVAIKQALGCVGMITNGAVRDVSKIRALGFHCFAGNVSVSRAYVHVTEFGVNVEIGGLSIKPGDLLYGDENGVVSIPPQIAADIPGAAAEIAERRRKTVELCTTPNFSTADLTKLTSMFGYSVSKSGMFLKTKDKDDRD